MVTSDRLPAVVLSLTAAGFLAWAVVLILSPGGASTLEWVQLAVSAGLLVFGVEAYLKPSQRKARRIRWLLLGFVAFGVLVVIGLSVDHDASRTWARLGWAALVSGVIGSVITWWNVPEVNRNTVIAGGVLGLILIGSGAGITLNCDDGIERSWCDPLFEQEQALVEIIVVDGELQRTGRAGGDTGPALMAYFVTHESIETNTRPPEGFVFEERPIQSIEEQRARYTTESGPHSHCQIDVKIEDIPVGTIETGMVTCKEPSGDV